MAPPSKVPDHNESALDVYRQLRSIGNLVFSPFSVRLALSMARAGATGETAAQMDAALRMPAWDSPESVALSDVAARARHLRGGCEISLANALWVQEGAPPRQSFLDEVERRFHAAVRTVDFHDSEAARAHINEWFEDETRRRVRDLISPGSLSPDARLLLANAISFRGRWHRPFAPGDTREQPFHLASGGDVDVPLMYQKKWMGYVQGDDFQAVDVPYADSELSMLVLVPDENDGLDAIEARLSAALLDRAVTGLTSREVELFLPRFTFEWGPANLEGALAALGMRLPFERGVADFSGVNGFPPPDERSLFIAAVVHNALVAVNEQGTEAAAVSRVTMYMVGSALVKRPPIPGVRADHPFLFVIRHRPSGAFLFLGRVTNPVG